ncbi:hypothetical protein AN639_10080 [Candidatus Epulonipiscium fishelsonii]|uniref:Uncharacterized protein n=1 Tax=Candidatus Epulonipiscium fishelsonii TaxID=77094 RepID=A0ACC8XEN2_9FIRM|nr:hypothetical protein AN396_03305 [Epulopiscium sp. SCG-B11WGA-EpuloA1]ONI43722.1 hypothetical protein AN639_10080 [Epulopiscium sp. SCG-B05WGA-EpuloA1]
MLIKTLIENNPSQNKSLYNEHGLSFYIEYNNLRILFDCGATKNASLNAIKMNIDLEKITHVIISHSHYDHAGGYPEFVLRGVKAPLYVGTEFWEEKYAKIDEKYVYLGVGFSQNSVEDLYECKDMIKLASGCHIIGNFELHNNKEQIPNRFVKQTKNGMIKDNFKDEIALVLEHEKGLIVIVGCSHIGILNILYSIEQRFQKPIYSVFGGTHLVEADLERTTYTIEQMKNIGVQILGCNHCTGIDAIEKLSKSDLTFFNLNVGECYIL